MSSPIVSIIVPLYNVENNVSFLVESIQKQTFSDWELILVNDGSSDNTLDVCRFYEKRDTRIRVISQHNQGPSVARNAGIAIAKGKWITFVDADDALLDNFLASMLVMTNNRHEIDIVYAGYIIVEQSANNVYSYDTASYIGKGAIHNVLTNTQILHRCSPWGKLFRKKIMIDNKLAFDAQLRHSEDRLFLYNYLLYTNGIATTSSIGYIYNCTSCMSLKSQRINLETLCFRQKKLQDAAHKVMAYYDITGEACFMFAKHLFGLFATSLQSMYMDMGLSRNTVENQQKFYDDFFDHKLYDDVKGSKKWLQLLKENQMLQWAVGKEFKRINYRLKSIDRKIAIIQFFSRILKKKFSKRTFVDAIHMMNVKEI